MIDKLTRRALTYIATLLLLPVLLYALAIAAIWWGQERLLFAPQVLAAEHRYNFGADVHETRGETA